MLMQRLWKKIALVAGVGIAATTMQAQSPSLKASRFGGISYVAVGDVAQYYGLGRDLSRASEEARYNAKVGDLSLEDERRDIELNGVTHWLSVPILQERSRLWISSTDVLKVIDPILRGGRSRDSVKIKTIVIDPGHGGTDRGTRGASVLEKDMTLDVARRVERLLEAQGFNVLLTRTNDKTLTLDDRVDFSRDRRADLFVSIHFNSGGTASGIETYCLPPAGAPSTGTPFRRFNSDYESLMGNRYDDKNVWLAHCIQKELLKETGAADRGVRRARFYVLRDVKCPSILVECGFLSNRAEEKQILSSSYRDQLAKAICDGILNYRKTAE
jgi:N-acetylmuramoyl-L-alanine amidase